MFRKLLLQKMRKEYWKKIRENMKAQEFLNSFKTLSI